MKKRGRPTKYRPIFVKKVKNYYKKCLKDNIMPFLEDLALLFKVDEETVNNWSKANKDFFGAIAQIKELQKKSLKKMALGNYMGAIFLLKANHGLVEKQHVLLSGAEGEEPITLVISKAPEPFDSAQGKPESKNEK